jgi:hypothetical protein
MNLSETIQPVSVPNVGLLLRIERRTTDGELIEVEYRWPTTAEAPTVFAPA